MNYRFFFACCLLWVVPTLSTAKVTLGIDQLFESQECEVLKGKRIGLIINQASMNSACESTLDIFKKKSTLYSLTALFSLEHGFKGTAAEGESVPHSQHEEGVAIYSLYGTTRRPTREMLKNIDLLVFDIQEIGSRSYTYITSLFYIMEEAAKNKIMLVVLDRPNPINGVVVDGPMLKDECRSFRGYIHVPYCHGMTIGELAYFFNAEYHIGCNLRIVKMDRWKRTMSFSDTGIPWAPTSSYMPENDTPLYYPIAGMLGELGIVNIGIGYTLPFKLIGAPWIKAQEFAERLNAQHLPGIRFIPYHFKPFYGLYADKECHGVKIVVTDPTIYRPVATQYLILGVLKSLYPNIMEKLLSQLPEGKISNFNLVSGDKIIFQLMLKEKYFAWKLIELANDEIEEFKIKRSQYLLY